MSFPPHVKEHDVVKYQNLMSTNSVRSLYFFFVFSFFHQMSQVWKFSSLFCLKLKLKSQIGSSKVSAIKQERKFHLPNVNSPFQTYAASLQPLVLDFDSPG